MVTMAQRHGRQSTGTIACNVSARLRHLPGFPSNAISAGIDSGLPATVWSGFESAALYRSGSVDTCIAHLDSHCFPACCLMYCCTPPGPRTPGGPGPRPAPVAVRNFAKLYITYHCLTMSLVTHDVSLPAASKYDIYCNSQGPRAPGGPGPRPVLVAVTG
jgi:hypothetical protein